LQLTVLGVDSAALREPVLDLGAGAEGALVQYLVGRGFDAYGIDRVAEDRPRLIIGDWLDAPLGKNEWGTILSHMAFSNHFLQIHRRSDPLATVYAARYMQILRALQVGGCFFYAPSLPFMETLLPVDRFSVRYRPVSGAPADDSALARAACITRRV